MTDDELVKSAQARLTEVAQRATHVHRTKKTRDWIIRTHNRWQFELGGIELTHEPVSDSTRAAYAELDQMMAILVTERGQDPDSILHWLDMFPALVVGVHLRVPQPHLA